MWRLISKPRTMQATRALIREFVEMDPCPNDRELSERRLLVYERILAADEFRPCVWASVECAETKAVYRLNGKHTSKLLESKTPIPPFFVTVERYKCDTLIEVGHLYGTFDSRLASRTRTDVNKAFAAVIPELKLMPSRMIDVLVGALAWQKWDEKYGGSTPAERAELMVDDIDFGVWLVKMLPKNPGSLRQYRHLQKIPTVSAMLASFRRNQKLATEFWDLVREETHPDRTHPSRVLAHWLLTAKSSNYSTGKVIRNNAVTATEIYVRCLHGWNAFRNGTTTSLKYFAAAPIPKVV